MVKSLLNKQSLEHAALIEIRGCPGFDDVSHVEIEAIADLRFEENWRIVCLHRSKCDVSAASASDLMAADRVAEFAQKKLRGLYNLCKQDVPFPVFDHRAASLTSPQPFGR
jgi:hypothetical protein